MPSICIKQKNKLNVWKCSSCLSKTDINAGSKEPWRLGDGARRPWTGTRGSLCFLTPGTPCSEKNRTAGAMVRATGRLGPLDWPQTCRYGVVRLARRIWQPCRRRVLPGYFKTCRLTRHPLSGARFFCKEITTFIYFITWKCSHDKSTIKLIQI